MDEAPWRTCVIIVWKRKFGSALARGRRDVVAFTKVGTLVEGLQRCKGHRSCKRSKNAPATASVGERNAYKAVPLQDQSWPSHPSV